MDILWPARSVLRRSRRSLARLSERADRRRKVYFLHIGKAAGTQIVNVIEQVNAQSSETRILNPGHGAKLRGIPAEADYFFSIRRPESRFRSAFYSRKRKGAPRYHKDWTENEARAFAAFEHANDLAEALFSGGAAGRQAFFAMKSIPHCSMNQVDWFDRAGFFLELRPPLWIIRQEAFEQDLAGLLGRLGYTGTHELARDPKGAHANDYRDVSPLSDLARRNLERWYAQDYEFYRLCCDWIEGVEPQPSVVALDVSQTSRVTGNRSAHAL